MKTLLAASAVVALLAGVAPVAAFDEEFIVETPSLAFAKSQPVGGADLRITGYSKAQTAGALESDVEAKRDTPSRAFR